jgi:hypothetical protein
LASGVNIAIRDIVACIEQSTAAHTQWRPGSREIIFPPIQIERLHTEFEFQPRSPIKALSSLCDAYKDYLKR